MARWRFSLCRSSSFSRRQLKETSKFLLYVTSCLAILTTFSIFHYMSSTSNLLIHPHLKPAYVNPELRLSEALTTNTLIIPTHPPSPPSSSSSSSSGIITISPHQQTYPSLLSNISSGVLERQLPKVISQFAADVIKNVSNNHNTEELFHERDIFVEDYKQMNKSLKIYVYPHKKNHPFANVLLPVEYEPGGNYASEGYFKKALFKSHFITNDPSRADLFFLPFSIASMRHDKRIGVGRIKRFVRSYVHNISRDYPYWNRTGGADHFYVACHSVGRTAMEEAVEVRLNSIQVVCSSSYFLSGYVSHKDASIPQIWPRKGNPPHREPNKRKTLAFYAGSMNSRERESLVRRWKNDSDISVHHTRLKTPYSEALLGSKYCLHAKGFEVNTARIGDAIYYGCVPVVLADHYDLPFADILNWKSFSIVVPTVEISQLKTILQDISFRGYLKLQSNVMKVQKHFQWHSIPRDYDAFYMVMYELWVRRSHLRLPINAFLDS